ncbi:MAG: TetR/AcrR family transcriptional regulator [Halioglobus sp.]
MNSSKENILHAASELFLEGGTHALSVRAIAKRAGVSTMGIYSHFEGKQGILEALYIEGFEAVDNAMSVFDQGLAPREAVLAAANNYFDLAERSPAHYSLVFGPSDAGYTPSDAAQQAGAKAFGKLLLLAKTALPEVASDEEAQMAAMRTWSMLHGAVSLRQHAIAEFVQMQNWREEVLESVLMLFDGFVERSNQRSIERS